MFTSTRARYSEGVRSLKRRIWGKGQFTWELLQPGGNRYFWQFITYAIYIPIYATVELKEVARHSNQTQQPLSDRKQIFLFSTQGEAKKNGMRRERRKKIKKGKNSEKKRKKEECIREYEILNRKKTDCYGFFLLLYHPQCSQETFTFSKH